MYNTPRARARQQERDAIIEGVWPGERACVMGAGAGGRRKRAHKNDKHIKKKYRTKRRTKDLDEVYLSPVLMAVCGSIDFTLN